MESKYLYLIRNTVDCQKPATLNIFTLNIEKMMHAEKTFLFYMDF